MEYKISFHYNHVGVDAMLQAYHDLAWQLFNKDELSIVESYHHAAFLDIEDILGKLSTALLASEKSNQENFFTALEALNRLHRIYRSDIKKAIITDCSHNLKRLYQQEYSYRAQWA